MKGLRLAAVGKGDAGAHLRPTTDRVRESLFNVLSNRIDFDDLNVMDIFAGTGALGLEALSRGAAHVTFVENGRPAQKILQENIRLTRSAEHTRLLRCDATRLPEGTPQHLIFLDPPYGKSMGEKAMQSAMAQGWTAPGTMLVWEDNTAPILPQGVTLLDQRPYGNTLITLAEIS